MLPIPTGYPIEQLSGPLIIGYLLNWDLFRTLSVQLYLYYLAFPKDRQFVKCLVYGIYIVEFVQMILVAYNAFAAFGYGFGDLEALAGIHFNWLSVPIMVAIGAFLGQSFYAYRIFILSKSQIVPALVICMSLASSVATISKQLTSLKFIIGRHPFPWRGYALCDIVIAICMTYYLMRSNTGFHCTEILVTKLIRLTIETGSLTAVVALAILVLFVAFPDHGYYATLTFIIMGGWDTYTSSTDMEIMSTMMRDITSHSMQSTQQIPVVAITKDIFHSDDKMG
ncbi:hypothetical protein F5146DRAFT_1133456 [Armillaria mellea]|nr:hypothetical protein F5146DRAFT_1133456 [Armillaria mellea]